MTEVYEPAITKLHFDELKDYAIRDLSRIKPGMEIITIHLPVLDYDDYFKSRAYPYASRKTVKEVRHATYSDIVSRGSCDNAETHDFIVFENDERVDYLFASDAGVIRYEPAGFFNPANFVVDMDELYRFGIEPILDSVSPKYAGEVATYNQQDFSYEDDFYNMGEL